MLGRGQFLILHRLRQLTQTRNTLKDFGQKATNTVLSPSCAPTCSDARRRRRYNWPTPPRRQIIGGVKRRGTFIKKKNKKKKK